jgi:eukaryotic-like serine/threonine-protein kinase
MFLDRGMTTPPATIGRYLIERLIAHGGMGSLYLARDPAIDRLVAIKVLKEGFDDEAARERFAREARAAGRLHHPNIVTVFDVGEHEKRPFIAMEFVSGETLAQIIKRRALTRVWEKLALLEDLCAGLYFAHTAGIVHRDIKPANVMRDDSGTLKILDFGIARAGTVGITRAGDVVGTLNYMSPEQLLGEHVDHRTDIYSVGALAYELLTNQMAFPGSVQTGVLSKILQANRVPLASLVPDIDPDICAVIDRAMTRDPNERHPDLAALREDFAAIRERLLETAPFEIAADSDAETLFAGARPPSGTLPKSASRARPSTLRKTARGLAAAETLALSKTSPRSSRKRAAFVGGGLALVLIVAIVAVWKPTPDEVASAPQEVAAQPSPAATTPPAASPAPTAAPPPAPAVEADTAAAQQLASRLDTIRATARQQIAAGQRQAALETLVTGLALAPKDEEIGAIVDELVGGARRAASQARASATRRGGAAGGSREFRDAEAQERDAETNLAAGDRGAGIRALWAAASLYNKVPDVRVSSTPQRPAPSLPAPSTVQTEPAAPPKSAPQPAVTPPLPPPPEPVRPSPTAEKPAPPVVSAAPPPVTKPEAPPAKEPAPDPRVVDQNAIRETLRRYTAAYESLDSDAVGRMMPWLTSDQLRLLARDFASYRSYSAEIRNERITISGATATVTCDVVRRFETKTGVAGGNTSQTTFHLRRSGSGWTIERLESR